jgi:hypothetical protein
MEKACWVQDFPVYNIMTLDGGETFTKLYGIAQWYNTCLVCTRPPMSFITNMKNSGMRQVFYIQDIF